MKIALIGPAYPYRGGIAHHTNMLYTYLKKHGHEVDVITFSRQYPKALYPGAFQEEQGDAGVFEGKIPSKRLIDSMNALNWVRVGRVLRKKEYDLYIFRFWLPLFGLTFGTIARMVRRKNRRNVMVVLDNVIAHEDRPGYQQLTSFFFRHVDMAISQSTTVMNQFKSMFPAIPQRMIPHPTYENFGERLPRQEVRSKLGVKAEKVILFFGFIRGYKGLDTLLAAMPGIIRRVPGVHLLIVGEFFEEKGQGKEWYLAKIKELGIEGSVTVHDSYVPNEEVAEWFSASDALVLPYHEATNSGIVQIGYNFATPAVVTNVGSLSEVVLDGTTGFVVPPGDLERLADAVARMFEEGTIERFSRNIEIERKRYSWDGFVEGIEALAAEIQKGDGSTPARARS